MTNDSAKDATKKSGIEMSLELIRSALWPAVALTGLIAFYGPIYSTLNAIAKRSDQIQTLKLGSVELNIKVTDLPRPSASTAEVLPSFNENMLIQLLWAQDKFGICVKPSIASLEKKTFDDLEKLEQVSIKKGEPYNDCAEWFDGSLTAKGKETRTFLINFISAQFRDTRSSQ